MIEKIAILITALVAFYGAVLSTINLIRQQREKKELLRDRVSHGFFVMPNGTLSPLMLLVEVASVSNQAVQVQPPHFKLPDNKNIVVPQPLVVGDFTRRFPVLLEPGRNITVAYAVDEFKQELYRGGYRTDEKFHVFVTDHTGRENYAKKSWRLR